MSFANKHNTSKVQFKFNIPESHNYKKLAYLINEYGSNHIHTIRGAFISTSLYGDQATVVTDNELVNFPKHMLETVKQILEDGESISIINNGNAGFTVYEYTNSKGKQHSVKFVDI